VSGVTVRGSRARSPGGIRPQRGGQEGGGGGRGSRQREVWEDAQSRVSPQPTGSAKRHKVMSSHCTLAGLLFLVISGSVTGGEPSRPRAPQKAESAFTRWREQFLNGGALTLVQEFGRAPFSRCDLAVVYFQPPLKGSDRVELRCTPNVRPRVKDLHTTRPLTISEIQTVAKLAAASDLYSGGHIGNFAAAGSEGPFERLEVGRCCGREDQVVLITTGNRTFTSGRRRELLDLLETWRKPLLAELKNRTWR
jgi:hypothetical protein